MKCIVTGGLGYIGSHTVVELQQAGYEVVILDNCSNSSPKVLKRIESITNIRPEHIIVSLDREDMVGKIQAHYDADAVIHFAACKSVGESMRDPLKYYRNNITGTCNLLTGMSLAGIKKLIFSSSCTVYGNPDKLPVTEKTPIKPANSVYGYTKQVCETMIKDLHRSYEYNSILLRYFNPVGAHDSAKIGELPIGTPDNLIPYVTQTASGKRDVLTIFGDDYDTPDGTCIRDYIHVVDLAKAHVLALDICDTSAAGAINLGTGTGYSVKEVVDTFKQVNNVDLNVQVGPRRDGDIPTIYADASFAKKILGWEAKLGLEDMVKSAWKWEKTLK